MRNISSVAILLSFAFSIDQATAQPPDLILHGGKIVTVDDKFSIAEAIAVRGERIIAVGSDNEVLKTKGEQTQVVDLAGKMVLPGLMDSHVHPSGAALHEFDHPIPEMETIEDVLKYIRARARVVPEGDWILLRQVFITRLREQRYPTKDELDQAAPKHPVMFSTGPDGMLSSLGLQVSSIDKDFKVVGNGYLEKDPATGELTGMLRSCTRFAKTKSSAKRPTKEEELARIAELFHDYNSVGLTSVCDRDCSSGAIANYQALREQGNLSVRMMISHGVDAQMKLEAVQGAIKKVAAHPLRKEDPRLRIIGVKCYLDGGMLTGSAYMREPWGLSKIYSITDPRYRGVLFIEPEKLLPIVRTTVESGLQFTAHSVGDGAVTNLVDAYEEINKTTPIRDTRPCITHCNFMTAEAIGRMARLGVNADIQPAWLYLDSRTLHAQFGETRTRYFQPLHTLFEKKVIAGGGSDHMQKIGSLRSVNPYNPFLAMWTTITRQARWYEGRMHPEEALTREQAIRFYSMNNAYILFLEKEVGSLEIGKQADLIVLDRDLLICPVDDIKETKVLKT
ncbi:MAG: amidohydrolase, partial [Pirellulaceae bacterium]|nr:amidohydrolase [Pirellulaceae bacterium]